MLICYRTVSVHRLLDLPIDTLFQFIALTSAILKYNIAQHSICYRHIVDLHGWGFWQRLVSS